jgi:DNA-binding GntR family transcriptional regulator
LKDRAYRELRESLLDGSIPPGAFLSERQLADRLGMSKTPIRAALERLEGDGLVTVSPQQGIVVRDVTLREIQELFDMRAAVEPFVARRVAGRLGPARAADLRDNLRKQAAAARKGDAAAAGALDVAFHLLLADALDNREVVQWLTRALAKLSREIVRISRNAEGRLLASYREHVAIAKAVLEGDGDRAAADMEDHFRFSRQSLVSG